MMYQEFGLSVRSAEKQNCSKVNFWNIIPITAFPQQSTQHELWSFTTAKVPCANVLWVNTSPQWALGAKLSWTICRTKLPKQSDIQLGTFYIWWTSMKALKPVL